MQNLVHLKICVVELFQIKKQESREGQIIYSKPETS